MILNPTDPILGIGIAAKKLGVSPQLLKKYEREGLIITQKTESGHRLYSEKDLEWIYFLHRQIIDNKMKIAGLRLLLALIPCWAIKSKCSKTGEFSSDCKSQQSRQFEFNYGFSISNIPTNADSINVWVPVEEATNAPA